VAVFKSLTGFYIKNRPGPHRLEGMTTKRNAGFVLARLPKDYPLTAPQKKVRDAAASCGIKAGMSRSALVTAMRTCIKSKF
jgi:hypothetical protein